MFRRYLKWNLAILELLIWTISGCSGNHPAQTVDASYASNLHRNYIIGLTPSMDGETGKAVEEFLFNLLLKEIPIGSKVTVFNAYDQQQIAAAEVPNHPGYTKLRPRANAIKPALKAIHEFVQNAQPNTNAMYQINVPEFCKTLAQRQNQSQGSPASVLIIGSALYQAESAFSMEDSFYPSDSHIYSDPADSVYSTMHLHNRLQGHHIHWLYLSEPGFNHRHKTKVARFWEIYWQRLGTSLGTFEKHLNDQTMKYIVRNDLTYEPKHAIPPDNDDKLIMYHVPDAQIPWEGDGPQNIRPHLLEGKIIVGLEWKDENSDLDLYCKPMHATEELYYRNMRTDYGTYFKDIRENTLNGVEYVKFSRNFHVNQIEIGVNYFRNLQPNRSENLEFTLILMLNGEVYQKTYSFPLSLPGNQGQGSEERQAPHWITLRGSDLLPDTAQTQLQ